MATLILYTVLYTIIHVWKFSQQVIFYKSNHLQVMVSLSS